MKFRYVVLIILVLVACEKKDKVEEKARRIYRRIKTEVIEDSENISEPLSSLEKLKDSQVSEESANLSENVKAKLWDSYRDTKDKLKEVKDGNNFKAIKRLLLKAARLTEKLGRPDIQSWQLNNIGYYSIEEFKDRVDYDQRIDKINKISNHKEREKYYQELVNDCKQELSLLKINKKYLQEAKVIAKELKDNEKLGIIRNNLNFIDEIEKMTESGAEK